MTMHHDPGSRLVISPCCNPQEPLDRLLPAYAGLGYAAMEAFTSWCTAALDWRSDPVAVRAEAAAHGIRYTSLHLPTLGAGAGLDDARAAARFAAALGVEVVLVKAATREAHIACDREIVAMAAGLGLAPVIQNHRGSPIETLAHVDEVLEGVADPRLGVLLEVGHYHAVGLDWLPCWTRHRERIALVHIKDMTGSRSVPYGTGEVDLGRLFSRLAADGYTGRYVVELELDDRRLDASSDQLRQARRHCQTLLGGIP